MKIIDADAFEKYAWGNPDIEVDGEPYISPSTVQNFAADHPITIDPPNEPLTLAELREMDGEPVWDEKGKCYLVDTTYQFCSDSDIEIAIVYKNGDVKRYPQRRALYRRPREGEANGK